MSTWDPRLVVLMAISSWGLCAVAISTVSVAAAAAWLVSPVVFAAWGAVLWRGADQPSVEDDQR